MKKSTKTSIVTGVVIVVIGVVVLLCALAMSGWNFSKVDNWEQKTFTTDADVTKLAIEVDVGEVVIHRSNASNIVVNYDYNDQYTPTFEENVAGVLSIETAKKNWYQFNFWFEKAPTIEIEIPQDCSPDIVLVLNAGKVAFGDGDWGELIDVTLNAGVLLMGNVAVKTMYLDINAGAFDANKIECDLFRCSVSAGTANVKKLDSNKISLNVSAGAVELRLAGAQMDYNATVSVSAGSCNIESNSYYVAKRYLNVDVSAGSVEIGFIN